VKIVIITGCLGFIGSHVTRKCLELGWMVRGVDKCTYAANVELIDEFKKYPNFTFDKIDINDLTFLYDCDYVIHLAASSHVTNSIVNSNDFIYNNICGTHNLLNLIKNNPYEYKPIFCSFSSDEVYADTLPYDSKETDILTPSSPYSASKAAADMLVLAYNRTFGVPYIIVRPANNWGKHQHPEKLIPKVIKYLSSFFSCSLVYAHATSDALILYPIV